MVVKSFSTSVCKQEANTKCYTFCSLLHMNCKVFWFQSMSALLALISNLWSTNILCASRCLCMSCYSRPSLEEENLYVWSKSFGYKVTIGLALTPYRVYDIERVASYWCQGHGGCWSLVSTMITLWYVFTIFFDDSSVLCVMLWDGVAWIQFMCFEINVQTIHVGWRFYLNNVWQHHDL